MSEPNAAPRQATLAGFECDTDVENLRIHSIMNYVAFLPNQVLDLIPHNHSYFEAHLLVGGSVNLVTTNGSCAMQKNDLCLLAPHLYHNAEELETPVSDIAFFFSYERIQAPKAGDLFSVFDDRMGALDGPLCFRQAFPLAHALFELTEEMGRGLPGKRDRLKTKTAQVIYALVDLICPDFRGDYEDNLSPATKQMLVIDSFFAKNHRRAVSIKELADAIYLSERQANRILLELYGLTFKQKLIETRIHTAMQLLQCTALSVSEISQKSGYQSAVGFHTAFRATCGMTPAKYRAKMRKQNALSPLSSH